MELQHWGIKGQKWGVRRYQNPDGSYTEEGIKRYQKKYPYQNPDGSLTERGKKNYMSAARKNKLDYKHLSDKDLDMINNRFGKEALYKRNVKAYQESTFKYRATQATKNAIISLLKGKKGKDGKGGEHNLLKQLLVKPVTDALKDAMKDGKSDSGKQVVEENKAKKLKKNKSKPEKTSARQIWENNGPVTNYPRLTGEIVLDANDYSVHSDSDEYTHFAIIRESDDVVH